MQHTHLLIQAALFDMDGVLVDNAAYHQQAWGAFARRLGKPLGPNDYMLHINGRVAAAALNYLLGRAPQPADVQQCVDEVDGLYRELYRPHLAPTPGVLAFLDYLKKRGIRIAVGTSAPAINVGFTLDGLGIRSYFDTVVDATMVSRGKPDPVVYLTAANRLGVEPAHCVVFEDALSGIEAGCRAGMAVVALATTHTPAQLADSGAALIISDFTDPRLLAWFP